MKVLATDACPYKGLAQFVAEDSAYFFGRERLVGELAARTVGVGFLGVVGASGSGKSSVIAAGLVPSLEAGLLPGSDRWTRASMRPGEHPMQSLLDCLSRESSDPLEEAIADLPSEGRLVLVVDQFEETFTLCATEGERVAFIEALAKAATRWPDRLAVIAAIRGDHYADCAPYPEIARALAGNHVLVGPLSRDQLRRVIELPARRAGLRVESALVDALVEEVAEEPGGLPLLSTALVELWRSRDPGWIRMGAYERTGGVHGAVARLAESSYAHLSETERGAARPIFLRLVATGEGEAVTRRRVPLDEFDLDRNAAAAGVLTRLTQDRLLTMGDGTVEVAHEALLREWPRLQGWLDEDAQGRLLRLQLTQASSQWRETDEEASDLFRGARLTAAIDWSSGHAEELNELERRFLATSRQASDQEAERQRRTNRRLRGLLAGVAGLLLIALVAGSLAIVKRGEAQRSATTADAHRLGAEALVAKDLDVSMLLAREGLTLDNSLATRSNLLGVVAKWNPAIGVIDPKIGSLVPDRRGGVDLSADGRYLVAMSYRIKPDAVLIETRTQQIVRRFDADPDFPPTFGGSNTLLVVPRDSSRVEGRDPETGAVEWSAKLPRKPANLVNMSLSLDGTMLAIVSYKDYMLIDTSTGKARTITPPKGTGFHDVQFTPDGNGLVEFRDSAVLDEKGNDTWVISRRSIQGLKLQQKSKPIAIDWRPEFLQNADWSADGQWIWTGNFDSTVRLYNTTTGAQHVMHTPDFPIREALSPNGKILVAGSHDHTLSVWRVRDGALLETLTGHTGSPNAGIRFSPDGRRLYTGGQDGSILVWDLSGDQRIGRPLSGMVDGSCDLDNGFAIGPGGDVVAAIHTSGVTCDHASGWVSLDDLSTKSRLHKFPAFPSDVAFSPDGSALSTAGRSGGVQLWDVASGEPIVQMPTNDMIWAFAFSPDGSILAAGGEDGTLHLLDARTGASLGGPLSMPVRRLAPPEPLGGVGTLGRTVEDVAFSPDGTELVASVGSSVVVWSVDDLSNEATLPLDDPFSRVDALAFSPDGRLLATGEGDGSLRLWNTSTWQEVGAGTKASTEAVLSVSFDRSGETLVTAGDDSTVRLFDSTTREEIGQAFPGIAGPPAFALFEPDGRHIVVGNFSYRAFEWNVDPSAWARHACEVAGRNFTMEEWRQFLPGRPYEAVCPASSGSESFRSWSGSHLRNAARDQTPVRQWRASR